MERERGGPSAESAPGVADGGHEGRRREERGAGQPEQIDPEEHFAAVVVDDEQRDGRDGHEQQRQRAAYQPAPQQQGRARQRGDGEHHQHIGATGEFGAGAGEFTGVSGA